MELIEDTLIYSNEAGYVVALAGSVTVTLDSTPPLAG